MIAAFFYVRVIVLMFFSEPSARRPDRRVPSPFTTVALAGAVAVTVVVGILPQPLLDLASRADVFVRCDMTGTPTNGHSATWTVCPPISSRPFAAAWRPSSSSCVTAVKSDVPFVTETASHLVEAGGKRFRPMLVVLAAQFGDAHAPGVVPSAVVVELTHLGTLYHDDVMDEAAIRRGAPSANARWTNTIAILTGDFLFSRASDLLADLGPEAVRIQARTFERLVTGQIRETVGPLDDEDAVEHYISVLADKTGSLIATCGHFGALLSGASDEIVDVMTRFGERIGVAFQLSDDLLDVAEREFAVRARHQAPTCAKASRRCRCSTPSRRPIRRMRGCRSYCAVTSTTTSDWRRRWRGFADLSGCSEHVAICAAGPTTPAARSATLARRARQGRARIAVRPRRRPHRLTSSRPRLSGRDQVRVADSRARPPRERVDGPPASVLPGFPGQGSVKPCSSRGRLPSRVDDQPPAADRATPTIDARLSTVKMISAVQTRAKPSSRTVPIGSWYSSTPMMSWSVGARYCSKSELRQRNADGGGAEEQQRDRGDNARAGEQHCMAEALLRERRSARERQCQRGRAVIGKSSTPVSTVRLSTAPTFAFFLSSPYVAKEKASTSAIHGTRP